MTLQRAFQVMGVVLVGLVLLGCGSDGDTENGEPAADEQQSVEVPSETEEREEAPPVEAITVVIETEARLDNRRQMQVSGTTNLPEGHSCR